MRISLVQMAIIEAAVDRNFKHLEKLLQEAILERPDIIVLPEMWNTGYALEQLEEIADEDGKKSKAFISAFAKKHHVTIVAGSVAVKKDNNFFNTTYVFDRQGQLIQTYEKVHLFGLMQEDQVMKSGASPSHFRVDDVLSSSIICYDLRFPEWLRTMMSQGSQILFVPAQWPTARVQQWELLLRARGIENQAFVVAVNRVGQAQGEHFPGHSMVIDPLGNIVLQAKDNQEGIFTVDIDLSEVEKVRGQIPVFEDRKPDLYK
ncbi:carbon-nitrogen family hydrolase [Streptococcus iniae]|nr:carbon-nitrogen family hydrolase [Streptococcus iniae]